MERDRARTYTRQLNKILVAPHLRFYARPASKSKALSS
jgi:hypothetical protein